ncbi:WD40-repeat-containing domain protein [Lentinula aciculospora]|uniref:WD40-repeat-containing domain protein n=1 Tax=Lentinula aciculospora TaxID=153920 RepID=A0A9W9DXX4_9AGAR|nr:WD40-repeat-containing domain protein [Lentinula aciculospora]
MSSSSIYNHRSLQPSGPGAVVAGPQHSMARINDSFEVIRNEFEVLLNEVGNIRSQRDDFESKVSSQVNELNIIRQSLYELEAQHDKVRQQYEEEVTRLRSEIHALRQGGGGMPPGGHSASIIGPGPAGPPSSISAGGGVPPFNDPYFSSRNDRDRDRDIARERERNERIERDRERDAMRDRDRDRNLDSRDPKRLKADRMKSERPDVFSPATLSKLPPPGASGPPPPSGPGQSSSGPGLPPSASSHGPLPSHPPGPSSTGTSPMMDVHPTVNNGSVVPINTPGGGFPDEADLASLPPEYKREGTDWFIVYNPKVEKVFNVSLVHTLMHESVVCCVRFSADGRWLATGCNRTAQIYDVKTGYKTCVLVDDSVGKSGDLYIRSVCFSPDGKYLATGAEDKQIRIWDIQRKKIRNIFDGHQQEIYSLDFSADGRLIVSGSGDKTARIWDMMDGTSKVLTINDPDSLNNDAGVTSVAISPNGHFVAAGSLDTVVRIWDVATGMLVERLRGHRDSVYSVAFTPDGKGLVSGSLDKTLKYWDVAALMAVGGSGAGASGSGSGSAGGVKSRKEGANGAGPNGPGGSSGVLKRDGDASKQSQCTMNFIGHKDYVLSVAVSHDGRWVVSGSKDRGVQFWDSKTAVMQSMLQGHKNSVISIDLSPTASTLATGSGDWQARIWSYA